jgi:hypothetical protein
MANPRRNAAAKRDPSRPLLYSHVDIFVMTAVRLCCAAAAN